MLVSSRLQSFVLATGPTWEAPFMLAVPLSLLEMLRLRAGAKVGLAVESGQSVVECRNGRATVSTNCWLNAIGGLAAALKNVRGSTTTPPAANCPDGAR